MAFLDPAQGWEAGRLALQILDLLCSPAVDLGGQHADLLARLHPVRRLSDVLCTLHPFTDEHIEAVGIAFCIFKRLSRHAIACCCHMICLARRDANPVFMSVQSRELLL